MSAQKRKDIVAAATSLLRKGRVTESLMQFDRAKVSPGYQLLMQSGNHCLDLGKRREAVAAFVRAGVLAAENGGSSRSMRGEKRR
jgi:hypothetical protein